MNAKATALNLGALIPETPPPRPRRASLEHAQGFARMLLREQKVPRLAERTAARALGLLLVRSEENPGEPVVISALEGSRLCDFEPRTWWLVKRRLLSLGHLVATTGGAPPSGRPGGRGHKAAYFVAPLTLARFKESPEQTENERPETLNGPGKTLKALPQTLNAPGEGRNLSHHRAHHGPLRLLDKKETSDVPFLEGDDAREEKPSPEKIWGWIRRERSERVKLRLLRLLETLLLSETLERVMSLRETGKAPELAPVETLKEPASKDPSRMAVKRRPRAANPLWERERNEETRSVFCHVEKILEESNRSFGASFEVARSARDTLRYPFEHVRSAVATVLLKKARGYSFTNPGAVLWEAITLEGYKLEEFSVAPFEEVLERIRKISPPPPPSPRNPPPPRPLAFEPERKRRLLLQEVYERLPKEARQDLDRRAEALALKELGASGSVLRLGLLKLDKRNELLQEEQVRLNAAPPAPQISDLGSDRNETEPIRLREPRT